MHAAHLVRVTAALGAVACAGRRRAPCAARRAYVSFETRPSGKCLAAVRATMPAVRTSLFACSCLALALAASPWRAAHAGPLPNLPTSSPVTPASAGNAGVPGAPVPMIERIRRGVVMLERDGRLIGFGTVLGGDGRILTALSALGNLGAGGAGDTVNVRYADGSAIAARVGHKDPSWDLALLVPRALKWKDGLSASSADAAILDLRAPIPLKLGARPMPLPVHYKGKTEVLSKQGEALMNALELDLHNTLPLAGAPLVDAAGMVAGVIVHACKLAIATQVPSPLTLAGKDPNASPDLMKAACVPTLVGAPVSAIRDFLVHTPPDAVAAAPWLGIVGQPDATGSVHGVRVMAVAPASPAEKGGLRSLPTPDRSDLIVAVDGQPVDTPEMLAEALTKRGIGESVKLLVYGIAPDPRARATDAAALPAPDAQASFREVTVALRASP
jgi:serine protease Do